MNTKTRPLCSIVGCGRPHFGRGWCDMHWKRWRRTGDPERRTVHRGDALARYWAKVDRRGPEECWPWTGATDRKGYGTIYWEGRSRSAHAVALLLSTGEPPWLGGRLVRHRCDNPPCQNPAHLLTGYHVENGMDMAERFRTAGQRLTGQDAADIRAAAAAGETQRSIARRYGVSPSTVGQVVRGVTHRYALLAAKG